MTIGEWGLLVLLSVLWGGSFFFTKVIVQQVPPFTLVLVRFTLAAGVLGAYLKAQGTPVPWTVAAWAAFAGMGALNNLIPVAHCLEPEDHSKRAVVRADCHDAGVLHPGRPLLHDR